MSYVQYQMKCLKCGETWTTAFGIVGTTQIASPTEKCPHCNSPQIKSVNHPWGMPQEVKITTTDKV